MTTEVKNAGAGQGGSLYPQAPLFAPVGGGASGAAAAATSDGAADGASRGAGAGGVGGVVAAGGAGGTVPSALNLDDIFGDCFFTPEGETVFLSDQPQAVREAIVGSAEAVPTQQASRPTANNVAASAPSAFVPVPSAGGIATTGLDKPGAPSTVMGAATAVPAGTTVGFVQPPQKRHHLAYAMVAPAAPPAPTKAGAAAVMSPSPPAPDGRKMSDQQKVERRERNREHAKRSRIRKKFLLESLQQSVTLLKEENDKLRDAIRTHLGSNEAEELLKAENLAEAAAAASAGNSAPSAPAPDGAAGAAAGLIANHSSDANKVLDDPDFSFIKALQTAQQNFVVTDPSLPDNPIVYATQGFLNLTGYTLDQVLGRNCRFLQGPETDPKAVEKIRRSIEDGTDMSVCLLNYRVDGTTFWNQFFIAALRDASGNITNYVGVQCKVSDQYAANVCKKQEEEEMVVGPAATPTSATGAVANGGAPGDDADDEEEEDGADNDEEAKM